MRTIKSVVEELEHFPCSSAWEKGVRDYAIDMFLGVAEYKRTWISDISEKELLDGEDNWLEYSHNGCALVYDKNIRDALCPDEPLDSRDWIDTQAVALLEAAELILRVVNEEIETLSVYNPNIKYRDMILFGNYNVEYPGGCCRFDNLTLKNLEKLIANRYIALGDRHNNAPAVEVFVNFMLDYPGYVATGYAITNKRADYRVSLDGLEKQVEGYDTKAELDRFYELFSNADELVMGTEHKMRCWFD